MSQDLSSYSLYSLPQSDFDIETEGKSSCLFSSIKSSYFFICSFLFKFADAFLVCEACSSDEWSIFSANDVLMTKDKIKELIYQQDPSFILLASHPKDYLFKFYGREEDALVYQATSVCNTRKSRRMWEPESRYWIRRCDNTLILSKKKENLPYSQKDFSEPKSTESPSVSDEIKVLSVSLNSLIESTCSLKHELATIKTEISSNVSNDNESVQDITEQESNTRSDIVSQFIGKISHLRKDSNVSLKS